MRLGIILDPAFGGPGARIQGVADGSAAAAMGLAGGDVLRAVDGKEVADARALRGLLAGKKPGDAVAVVVDRGAEILERTGRFSAETREPLFKRDRPWGSLRAEWKGDDLEVACAGIGSFEVWVPADRVVAGRPIRILVNGKAAFEGVPAADPGFLLDRAAEDADRRLVYGARIPVELK